MKLSAQDWHRRFVQQAAWTSTLREHLLGRLEEKTPKTLEVGCGTGAVLAELSDRFPEVHGLDPNLTYLVLAGENADQARRVLGDGHTLPYADGSFDLVTCHFLLLWVDNPLQVVEEMHRVARPGGAVFAFAEPDYGGRIDYPAELEPLGRWQEAALQTQGACTRLGRRLAEIFHQAGLAQVETGLLGGQW